MSYQAIKDLVGYALRTRLIDEYDRPWAVNKLLKAMGMDAWEEPAETHERPLEDILKELLDDAAARGRIEDDTTNRDLFDTELMGRLTPRPSQVISEFRRRYQAGPKDATDWFYRFSQDTDLNPDNKEAEEKFKEVNEAYEVLSDSDKKARYDQFGFAGVDPNYGAGAGGGAYGAGGFDFGDLGDIFGSFFGGGFGSAQRRNPNAPQRGESIRLSVTISFEEAAFGCEKEVSVDRYETCAVCHGSGCADGTSPEVCPDCHGSGQVQVRRQTPMGVFATTSPCGRCGGKGRIIKTPCTACRGSGLERKRRTIQAKIPAGIDNGQTISIRGQGHAGKNGGPSGDLLITITVRPHELFRREGTSVLCEAPITFAQAVLGAELEIPTIDGKVKYDLPEGTQSGTTCRLKGKGIPELNGRGRGDQYVTVYIETPRNLNREQKEALKKFAESVGDNNYEERKKFFKKFKK